MSTKRRGPSVPTHLAAAQARRLLKAQGIFIPWGTMHNLMMAGREMEAETHWGGRMVPMWRILAYVCDRQASEKPQDRTPGPQA